MKSKVPAIRYVVEITGEENLGERAGMVQSLARRTASHRAGVGAKWAASLAATRRKREELLARLAYHPDPVPLRPKLLREETFPTYLRRTYRLQINPDDKTEAFLYLPREASKKNPVPVIIGIHSGGGQWTMGRTKLCDIAGCPKPFRNALQKSYGGQAPADYFARNGFAVLVIDQLSYGSRALWKRGEKQFHDGRTPVTEAREMQVRLRMRYEKSWYHRALLALGVTEAEICLYDNRRSIDFLESIPEVDASRLGAFGLSVGAILCHQFAAFDPRVKASVRACWSGDLEVMLNHNGPRVLGTDFLFPGINAECHVPELVALSNPNAVLILNARQDRMYPFAAQEKTRRETLRLARLAGRGDRVRWRYFDGPHSFHPPQQLQALEFFREFLGE